MMLSGQSAGLQVKYFWGAGTPLHVGIFSLVFGGLVVKKKELCLHHIGKRRLRNIR